MTMHIRWPFSLLFFVLTGLALRGAQPDTIKADEETLKAANVGTDGASLIEFLRGKIPDDANRDKINALIRSLGADGFEVREQASTELAKFGAKATSLLRQATRSDDIEVVRRAEQCLRQIEKTTGAAVTAAATRLVAVRKPVSVTETLLKFAPFADDDNVLDAVRDALAATAAKDGKADTALTEAISANLPLTRGLAGEALVRAGQSSALPALRKLMEDPDRLVRVRVGLAFVETKDKSTLPMLIDLLAELPREHTQPIEELLGRIALEKSPNVPLGDTEPARKKCRDAWKEWWDKNGEGIDLAKMDLGERMLGYTLLVSLDPNTGMGKVVELDRHGKERWKIDGLMMPMDARVIGTDRVLITDYRARKVTERNFKGEVLWEKSVGGFPICSQRLANGNTLIFTRNQVLDVDTTGKELMTINRPGQDILSGQRLKDGNILVATRTGQLVQFDREGKELKSIPVALGGLIGTGIDVTPEGNFLVPMQPQNVIAEIDVTGKSIRQINVNQPTGVQRLPNGNLLIGSMFSQQAVELDRDGKQIWSMDGLGQLYRVRRR